MQPNQPQAKTCGAKTRSGVPCQNPPMPNGRCRMHGGKSLAGVASPQFKTGKFSKLLPARLIERYEDAAADSELLSLRDEIALVDTRIADLLRRVDTGEAGALWSQALQTYDSFVSAQRDAQAATTDRARQDAANRSRDALVTLGNLLDRGAADHVTWGEIMLQLETRRRLIESERRRLVDMQQMITSEQAVTLVTALLESVRENVDDRDTLNRIQTTFVRLTSSVGGDRPG